MKLAISVFGSQEASAEIRSHEFIAIWLILAHWMLNIQAFDSSLVVHSKG